MDAQEEALVWARNAPRLHRLYVTKQYQDCMNGLDCGMRSDTVVNDYGMTLKAMVLQQQGKVHESLKLFQELTRADTTNISNLKHVARSFFLLGRHKQAIGVYDEALKYAGTDWEILMNKGVSLVFLKDFEKAERTLVEALGVHRHDSSYAQLGNLYLLRSNIGEAIALYQQALKISPESTDILVQLGLLYLGQQYLPQAIDLFGQTLTNDPTNLRGLLAFCSILQVSGEHDAALLKYRVAVAMSESSYQVWNNVGMCFYAKDKVVAAIACLKRAHYLAPFEWSISYNLGLTYVKAEQYASAAQYLEASQRLHPTFALTYLWMGVSLQKMGEMEEAVIAFEQALSLDSKNVFIRLNYGLALALNDRQIEAQEHHDVAKEILNSWTDGVDPTISQALSQLKRLVNAAEI
ncbi:Bardet-Biedl syndrome protein 4 [Cladochytrium replicatum]|nr:Bardet-Biedl syndrome protein 4 [Cladochytrium replicatum]